MRRMLELRAISYIGLFMISCRRNHEISTRWRGENPDATSGRSRNATRSLKPGTCRSLPGAGRANGRARAEARAPDDAADIAEGLRLYQQKGNPLGAGQVRSLQDDLALV